GRYPRPEHSKSPKYYSELAARNREFHDWWTTTLTRSTNKISLDILIVALRFRTEDRLEDFQLRTLLRVDTGITNVVRKLHADLQTLDPENVSSAEQIQCEIDTSLTIDEGVEQLRERLLELSRALPEELTIGDADTREIKIPVARLANRILESRLIAPLQEFLADENDSLRSTGFRINDLVNLTRFNLKNIDTEKSDSRQVTVDILNKTIDSVSLELESVENFKSSLEQEIATLLADAFDPLSPEKIEK
ncbi:MAG: hypothetical protein P8Z37_04900, partial [Acidobacteriota bacterium]